ncbi:MAG: response regulator [Bdellovibrionales bacterium]|nr:response regulator [Bdellovibrionales bacterium]
MARVLVVDDRPVNCYYLRAVLESFGHGVIEAYGGPEALELIEKEVPDLIITDIVMPELDGYELATLVNADDSRPPVPVIFYTATFSNQDAEKLADGCGAAVVLPKPSEPTDIIAAVHDTLGLPLSDESVGHGAAAIGKPTAWKDSYYEQLAKANPQKLTRIIQLALQAGSDRNPDTVLSRYGETARGIVDARWCALGIPSANKSDLAYWLRFGFDEATRTTMAPPSREQVDRLMMVLPSRRSGPPSEFEDLSFPEGHPPVGSMVTVPIASPTSLHGWLYVANGPEERAFTDEDQNLLFFLGAQAGIAYENLVLTREIQQDAHLLQKKIEELRRAELLAQAQATELTEWMDRYSAAIDASGQVLYDYEPAADSLVFSGEVGEILGYQKEQLPTTLDAWHALIEPSQQHHVRCVKAASLSANEPYAVEYDVRRKDGSYVAVLDRGRAVHSSDGALKRVIGFLSDVTAQNTTRALEQERNSLQAALKSFERILGVVGHELRTPLAAIRASAELVLMLDADTVGEHTSYVRAIHDEAVRMVAMVNDMLEVARLNSGIAHWNWSEFEARAVCEEALASVRYLLKDRDISLELHCEPESFLMQGDPSAVRRLLINLLSNSLKHTASGFVRVSATVTEEGNHQMADFSVQDTGSGIAPDIARNLGVAFALNAGLVGEAGVKGSGLGLAICRGIVAAHGGTIAIESLPQQGTTVKVRLRADLDRPAALGEPAAITHE